MTKNTGPKTRTTVTLKKPERGIKNARDAAKFKHAEFRRIRAPKTRPPRLVSGKAKVARFYARRVLRKTGRVALKTGGKLVRLPVRATVYGVKRGAKAGVKKLAKIAVEPATGRRGDTSTPEGEASRAACRTARLPARAVRGTYRFAKPRLAARFTTRFAGESRFAETRLAGGGRLKTKARRDSGFRRSGDPARKNAAKTRANRNAHVRVVSRESAAARAKKRFVKFKKRTLARVPRTPADLARIVGRGVRKQAILLLAKAAAALIALLVPALVAISVVLVASLVVIVASPLGILFSRNVEGSIPIHDAADRLTGEHRAKIEAIRAAHSGARHVYTEGNGPADMTDVIAVFAVRANETGDVVQIDEAKFGIMRTVFWDMNKITYRIKLYETHYDLYITVTHKTAEEMPAVYGWNAEKKSALRSLLEQRELIARLIEDDFVAAFSEVEFGEFDYEGNGTLIWPVPGMTRVSSEMGYRIHPIYGYRKLHTGMDIPAPTGTPVVAAADGLVVKAGGYGVYGNVVMIDHGIMPGGDRLVTLYAHNDSVSVSAGGSVTAGDEIARIGSTGDSTGPHCHFEVRLSGVFQNPRLWL